MYVHASVFGFFGTRVHANDASEMKKDSTHTTAPAAHRAFISFHSLSCSSPPLPHFAFSDALSLSQYMINVNDHDPAAIASRGHFVEFAKPPAFDAAPFKAIFELRVPTIIVVFLQGCRQKAASYPQH